MDTKELRIGNWVQFKTCTNELLEGMVTEVFCERASSGGWFVDSPIPLTEEWLVKLGVHLGFTTENNQYMIKDMLDSYCLRLSYDVGMSKFISELKHVHQLQNLYFALTGEELEIKKP